MKIRIKDESGYGYRTNELIKVQTELIKSLQNENSSLRIMIDDRDKVINMLTEKKHG